MGSHVQRRNWTSPWAKPPSTRGVSQDEQLGSQTRLSRLLTDLSARREKSAPPGATLLRLSRQACMGSPAPRPVRFSGNRSVHRPPVEFSRPDLEPLRIQRNYLSIEPKNRRGLPSLSNASRQPHEKDGVDADASACSRTGGLERIAGWRLVRTHAADAPRVLPRRATPRPLGASLLAAKASPDWGLLGASLLATQTPRRWPRCPSVRRARAVSRSVSTYESPRARKPRSAPSRRPPGWPCQS
jgi:hypothetical protein